MENYEQLLAGAHDMDKHFVEQPLESNLPVILALLGIWYANFFEAESQVILPYDHNLGLLPAYLEQADMESNGKSVSKQGVKLNWQTAPIVFGQEGTNGQHAFMQLMHQSDEIIPTDFIVALKGTSLLDEHHQVLIANCFAQSEALMQGKSLAQVSAELRESGTNKIENDFLAPHKTMKGNTPSSTLLMPSLTPKSFGAILALYEHKIFVQGMLWQVNSYDQWGVELGKQLSEQVLSYMADNSVEHTMSPSSIKLIETFVQKSTNI